MNGPWPTDDEFDDDADSLPPEDGTPPHWGQSPFDSLQAMRQHVSDQLDDLLASLDDERVDVGARFLVDATLDCCIEFFAMDESEAVGADDSLFILARDRRGLADPAQVAALFDYLIEDLAGALAEVDSSQLEAVFADGDRPLALLGGDGLPLDLEAVLQRGDWR